MCLDGIGEVHDRASEGQAVGVYEAGFATDSFAEIGLGGLGSRIRLILRRNW